MKIENSNPKSETTSFYREIPYRQNSEKLCEQFEEQSVGKMASTLLRNIRVPPNSVSLEEARNRTFNFFKVACRSIPTIMDMYNLDDVVKPSQLRSIIASEIRKNSHITDIKVRLLFFSPSSFRLTRRHFFSGV